MRCARARGVWGRGLRYHRSDSKTCGACCLGPVRLQTGLKPQGPALPAPPHRLLTSSESPEMTSAQSCFLLNAFSSRWASPRLATFAEKGHC